MNTARFLFSKRNCKVGIYLTGLYELTLYFVLKINKEKSVLFINYENYC